MLLLLSAALQIDPPFKHKIKQLISKPIRSLKRFFSFSRQQDTPVQSQVVDLPDGSLQIQHSNVLQLAVPEAQPEGAVQVDFEELNVSSSKHK